MSLGRYFAGLMPKYSRMKGTKTERTYHRNGRIYQEVPFVKGKIHGLIREWHKNGTLAKEIPMKEGVRHGVCKEWNDAGQLLGTFEMRMGTGVSKHWFPDGQLGLEISVINEAFTGRQRQWDEDGNLIEENFFLNNRRVAKDDYDRACRLDSSLPSYMDEPQAHRVAAQRNKSEQLIKRLLATKHSEAIEWLKRNGRAAKKTLAELSAKKSVALVAELYKAGAVRVLAVDIDEGPNGNENTDKLVVDLPRETAKRKAIFELCGGKQFPCSPEADQGQSRVAIFLG